ncbi:hypothetical protein M422DRAFT_267316 [Sphaerobolus stellatus SS14]|uniref:Uncharacterized protein n=1 Tax=Sphaerobolus stellatus (strain SS14) TaxID=990650 RepID=A0A0C9UPZ4_SPHS4|nr:hypothetical protein M422DRAFT_267316 [Sphaerobolus stellatus SS14]
MSDAPNSLQLVLKGIGPTVFDTTVYDPDTAAFLTLSIVLNMVVLGGKDCPILTLLTFTDISRHPSSSFPTLARPRLADSYVVCSLQRCRDLLHRYRPSSSPLSAILSPIVLIFVLVAFNASPSSTPSRISLPPVHLPPSHTVPHNVFLFTPAVPHYLSSTTFAHRLSCTVHCPTSTSTSSFPVPVLVQRLQDLLHLPTIGFAAVTVTMSIAPHRSRIPPPSHFVTFAAPPIPAMALIFTIVTISHAHVDCVGAEACCPCLCAHPIP